MENSFSLTAETVTHITRTCGMSVLYLFPLNAACHSNWCTVRALVVSLISLRVLKHTR